MNKQEQQYMYENKEEEYTKAQLTMKVKELEEINRLLAIDVEDITNQISKMLVIIDKLIDKL